ncbi:MAG: hypothetical protein H7837_05955 [Magnetococcus sp. MYC-9]
MIEALKNKRTLMIGGGALVGVLLLGLGYRILFGASNEEDVVSKDKGAWVPSAIPDLPPLVFNPNKDWGAQALQLAQENSVARAKVRAGVRVERDKSDAFDEELITVEQVQTDRSVPDMPRILIRMNHRGDRIVDNVRMDILFLDQKSALLARRPVNPLVVAGSLTGDKVKPLQPGEQREFYVDATQAPLGWLEQVGTELVYYQFAP